MDVAVDVAPVLGMESEVGADVVGLDVPRAVLAVDRNCFVASVPPQPANTEIETTRTADSDTSPTLRRR